MGLRLSSGDFIAFLDDDEWLPDKLKKQVDLIVESGSKTGIVHTNALIDNGEKLLPYHREKIKDQSMDYRLG